MEHPVVHYLFADCGGRLVEIGDFERGAHPAPLCPGCGETLVAVQGAQRGWHFRHKSGGGCDEAEYEAACAALEQRARRAQAGRRRAAAQDAGAAAVELVAEAPWLRHPVIVGVGLLAAASLLYLIGEARRR